MGWLHEYNDMSQSPQFVQGLQGPLALNAVLPAYQKEDCRADENHGADAGIQSLD
jgi:hypothetical protein